MVKESASASRKSVRISELVEKSRILSVQNLTEASSSSPPAPPPKRRGRKPKSLQAVVTASPHQEGEEQKTEDNAAEAERTENSQQMSLKETLELAIDVLQRRDTHEIFAEPVDPEKVAGYYSIINEPMDFGTMRAKLQEGMYTSLRQFERDVHLIITNATLFNSRGTVYYREARTIGDLAKRVLRALKNEPENFELDEWQPSRRSSTRRAPSASGQSRTRRTASYRAVSRNAKELNTSATNRRVTYVSPKLSSSYNEKLVSTVYNAPKLLTQVSNAGSQYADSLKNFVKDLGPAAQTVADKKLGKRSIESSNAFSRTSTPWQPFGRTDDSLLLAPSALQNPAYLNGHDGGRMPNNIISNLPGSYKGKMVCTDEGMSTYGRELIPRNNFAGASPQTNDCGLIDYNLLTDACGSSKSSDNMDNFIASLTQISAIQDETSNIPSGKNFPFTGCAYVPPAISSLNNDESLSRMLNSLPTPTILPYQTSTLSSASKAISSTTLTGFQNGEGPSTASPTATALDQNKLLERKQAETRGLPAICDLPDLQTQANNLIQPTQNVFNSMNFLGRANPQGHQAESSTQGFWKALQASLMDDEYPELDLQL